MVGTRSCAWQRQWLGCWKSELVSGAADIGFGIGRGFLILSGMQTRGVEIVRTEGGLPEFWDRSAVFFANLLALFFGNEKGSQVLSDEVGEVDS